MVTNILKRRLGETFQQEKMKLGPKFKTTLAQNRRLGLSVLRNRKASAKSHLFSSGVQLSEWTIRRILKKLGIRRRLAVQNVLTRPQRVARVQFAKANINRNWGNIIFSDECVVTLRKCRNVGKLYVYRKDGERRQLLISVTIPKV